MWTSTNFLRRGDVFKEKQISQCRLQVHLRLDYAAHQNCIHISTVLIHANLVIQDRFDWLHVRAYSLARWIVATSLSKWWRLCHCSVQSFHFWRSEHALPREVLLLIQHRWPSVHICLSGQICTKDLLHNVQTITRDKIFYSKAWWLESDSTVAVYDSVSSALDIIRKPTRPQEWLPERLDTTCGIPQGSI